MKFAADAVKYRKVCNIKCCFSVILSDLSGYWSQNLFYIDKIVP